MKMWWQFIAGINGMMAMIMATVAMHAFHIGQLAAMVSTASFYQLIHAIVLLWLVGREDIFHAAARWFLFGGMVLFSGSLYVKAFFFQYDVSFLTPYGGGCYIVGWLCVALGPRFGRKWWEKK